ncbi:sigma-70 family RNA polymerase sigma factor [Arcicella sp. DC2W]|uniref:Sigma-70 family RNA polymerase sigma factor n=1 Tax=Arcicella gelida TaxID=2984195 RepID=A0ABU5S8P6_9BACT|nr:sigma-70 family RNA polymerase sigma factor [Arcicella sp. DC2W]MEA5404840.1 sigma-70 family RNA polymerase sigma factor [Arcicella sp. DC2W]
MNQITEESNKEQEMWEAFLLGDEEAYTELYRLHVKAMYRYGMSLVAASEAFVFDCIHDVFTEIWIKRNRLIVPDNVRYYLLKALKNRILHLLSRKERSHQTFNEEFEDFLVEPSAEEIFTQKEEATNRQEMITKLVSQLSHRQQEALRLRFAENMNYEQIAEIMLVNKQSAQNIVFRAVEKLRTWLSILFFVFFQE